MIVTTVRIFLVGMALASVLLLANFVVNKTRPDIIWQTPILQKSVSQGAQVSEDISFIVNKTLENLSVWVSPEIRDYVFARPLQFSRLEAGTLVRVQVIFIIPDTLQPGSYDGTIHIRQEQKTIAKPLPVYLTVTPKPEPSPQPAPIELFYDDGSAEGFDFDPVFGRAVFFTKFVASGQSVKILGAKIFLKVVTQPASPIDVYVWDFDRKPLISHVRVTPLEEGWKKAGWWLIFLLLIWWWRMNFILVSPGRRLKRRRF